MSNIILKGNTSGQVTIAAPDVGNNNTLTLPSTSSTLATQNALGVRNLIINGDMRIDQRNAGSSVTISSALYTLDRWQATQSVSSKYSVQQVTDAPTGATHSLKATSLSAYTVGTSESFVIRQQIEGNNIAHLDWGTSNAKTVTLSFWVKSSLTGTFGAIIKSNAGGRTYPVTYDIDSANTWEQKSITIPGDTTGTWLTTNGVGIQVVFNIGTGASLSGTANTWSSTNYNSATGATSLLATNGATLQLSLIQLEVGDTATPFEHRPYDMELARCKRYCHVIESTSVTGRQTICSACSHTTTAGIGFLQLPVEMRTLPSLSLSAVGHWAVHMPGINRSVLTALALGANGDQKSLYITYSHASHASYGSMKYVFIDTWSAGTGQFILSAEL